MKKIRTRLVSTLVFVGGAPVLFTLFVFVVEALVLFTLILFVEELMSCIRYLYL